MKIKKQKQNIVINTENKNIILYRGGTVDFAEFSGVVNLSTEEIDGNKVMNIPGEYEIEDVLYSIFSYGEDIDHPDIVFIDSNENIRVLFILSTVETIDKSIIERLPDINILIAELDGSSLSKKLQLVSDIEPDYFLPLVDKGRIDELSKEMGIASIESISSLNIGQKDFSEESSELKVLILNN